MKKSATPKFAKTQLTKIYSKILIGFCILAALILVIVIYFAFSKTKINVALNREYTTSEFDILVQEEETAENVLRLTGHPASVKVEGKKEYYDLTSVATKVDKATGIVTIYNNYSADQPLVATTRLSSDEGVIFRTQESIVVPRGQAVAVNVVADQPGEVGNIPASRFIIVALWPGKQDKIYGESTQAMTGGVKNVTVATEENINQAKNQAIAELMNQGLQKLDQQVKKQNPAATLIKSAATYKIIDQLVSAEPDKEVDIITVDTKISVIAAVFDEENLKTIAEEQLKSALTDEQKLDQFLANELEYEIVAFDLEKNSCRLKVKANGLVTLRLSSPIFNRKNLTNKDKQEIRTYFLGFDQVKRVDIKFSPFWVFRSPAWPDKIEIEIVEN